MTLKLFEEKIEIFYKKRNEIFKKPLEKIINSMLDNCRYINGESLERHNWGNKPIKLINIPLDINSNSFEDDLLNALNIEENEKSIIELLWGDIQLGKRVQACIIMWISVYILKRPVLYIFRNLSIDQKQLQDDISGTEKYNFNIQFIKKIFEEFNKEINTYLHETNIDYWKEYKLPELKDINNDDIINKLSNKEALNSNDIFCCLMNNTQLKKINNKFNEYIAYNKELIDISVLVDESDLMSPTASNDYSNEKDEKDSTECERLLSTIYKKVKYVLHITGTAHSLLYNITTRLKKDNNIQIKISKVHKMKRSDDYYGLFNNRINFNTKIVKAWWDNKTDDKEENKKRIKYNISKDYNLNIKNIIEEILKRPKTIKYNSLLLSEEKIRSKQFDLIKEIIKDFQNLFIVIYHGGCLKLYLSKDYEEEIKHWSEWDFNKSSSGKRLWQKGGIYGSSNDFENNYCYYEIDTKIINIKMIYKLLRILFKETNISLEHKTVITITGKYGERGYSFTSDDYNTYSFHLTDQYFVSHSSFNCTDISQRLRLQGKYNDYEIKKGLIKLNLWTTKDLEDVIQNFYVKFIKEIEKDIMSCQKWEDIKDLIENIIDNGELKFGKYMKHIDVSKKRKNIKIKTYFDKKEKAFKLLNINNMTELEISEWCKKENLPNYNENCINEIKTINKEEFTDNKFKKAGVPIKITLNQSNLDKLNDFHEKYQNKNNIAKLSPENREEFVSCIKDAFPKNFSGKNLINKKMINKFDPKYEIINIKEHIKNNKPKNPDKNCENSNDYIIYIILDDIPEWNCKKCDCFILYYTNDYIILDKSEGSINPFKNNNIFITIDNIVKYSSILKDNKLLELNQYYWKTLDGWLYLYDENKKKNEMTSLSILTSQSENEVIIKKIKK